MDLLFPLPSRVTPTGDGPSPGGRRRPGLPSPLPAHPPVESAHRRRPPEGAGAPEPVELRSDLAALAAGGLELAPGGLELRPERPGTSSSPRAASSCCLQSSSCCLESSSRVACIGDTGGAPARASSASALAAASSSSRRRSDRVSSSSSDRRTASRISNLSSMSSRERSRRRAFRTASSPWSTTALTTNWYVSASGSVSMRSINGRSNSSRLTPISVPNTGMTMRSSSTGDRPHSASSLEQGLVGEEPEVGAVQQSHRPVPEATVEQGQAHVGMGHVGYRRDDEAGRAEQGRGPTHDAGRILDVLEDVPEHDGVEGVAGQLLPGGAVLHVAHDHPVGVVTGAPGGVGVELDPDDRAPAGGERSGHMTAGAPHLQNSPVPPHHADGRRVGVVGAFGVDVHLVDRVRLGHPGGGRVVHGGASRLQIMARNGTPRVR